MTPLIGIGVALIVFNVWQKRRIERKQRKENQKPRWKDQMDKEGYNEELKKLKLKYMLGEDEEVGPEEEQE